MWSNVSPMRVNKVVKVQPIYDFFSLVAAMKLRTKTTIMSNEGIEYTGTVQHLRAEDGSGKSWVVGVYVESLRAEVQVWLRTS